MIETGVHSSAKKFPTWGYAAVLIALCFVSRLPQLLSPKLFLDGDECVMGLMAKHALEGRGIPMFLWGASYGFSLIETSAGALGILIFGFGAASLKIGILAVWSLGALFSFEALSSLLGNRRAFLATSLLIFAPAWAVMSMKALGGYATAFALTSIVIYLAVRLRDKPGKAVWILIGGLTALVYYAERLWLPGLLPVVLYVLIKRRRLADWAGWMVGGTAVGLLLELIQRGMYAVVRLPPVARSFGFANLVNLVLAVPSRIYANLTGSYFLTSNIEPGLVTKVAAVLWGVSISAGILFQVYRLAKRRSHPWSNVFFLSTVLSAGLALLPAYEFGPRYVLPLIGFAVLWLGTTAADWGDRGGRLRAAHVFLLAGFIGLGAFSIAEFRNFTFTGRFSNFGMTEANRMNTLVTYLKSHEIRSTFSMHPLLQWQVVFYSREGILSRWEIDKDRYPEYSLAVDRVLREGGKTALVGYVPQEDLVRSLVSDPKTVVRVADEYFVYIGPDEKLLRRLKFEFKEAGD